MTEQNGRKNPGSRELTLGYSPCPNDTFIFYGLTHGMVEIPGVSLSVTHDDVETLNRLAMDARLDLTKVSFHALAYLREKYFLLRSGAALGRGCGPLVVAREQFEMGALKGKRIAVPGRYTTAQLLLMLYDEGYDNVEVMPYDRIMGSVKDGSVDAGLIIHEGRFTYEAGGLKKILDLGEWWEAETGLPIPLGGILARRSLGKDMAAAVEAGIRRSIEYAYANRDEVRPYIRAHAQELDDEVIDSHISLYVNDFSLELGDEGERAVGELFERAMSRGVVPGSMVSLFA